MHIIDVLVVDCWDHNLICIVTSWCTELSRRENSIPKTKIMILKMTIVIHHCTHLHCCNYGYGTHPYHARQMESSSRTFSYIACIKVCIFLRKKILWAKLGFKNLTWKIKSKKPISASINSLFKSINIKQIWLLRLLYLEFNDPPNFQTRTFTSSFPSFFFSSSFSFHLLRRQ